MARYTPSRRLLLKTRCFPPGIGGPRSHCLPAGISAVRAFLRPYEESSTTLMLAKGEPQRFLARKNTVRRGRSGVTLFLI